MATVNWDFSNLVPNEDAPLSEGLHTLYIESASMHPIDFIYSIKFRSLTKDKESSVLKFYLKTKDSADFNNATVGTLNSLTRAIDGPSGKGILASDDLVKRVVKAEVKLSKPKEYGGEMRQYPAIYEFKPVEKTELDIASQIGYELNDRYPQYAI